MRVAILGAGVAGLSAGWLLRRRGVDVTVFERQAYVGGLARSFTWHGFSCDFAAHRLFCEDDVILQQLLALVPMGRHVRRSQIRLHGKWLHDPVNVAELMLRFFPKATFQIPFSYVFRPRGGVTDSFEEYVLHRYGKALCDLFFAPYTEKMFGLPANQVALEWALRKVRIAGPFDAIRASSKKNFGYFYYPVRGGYGSIVNHLAQEIADDILLESTVTNLRTDESSISSITYQRNGQAHEESFDQVISTLPLTVLGRMLGEQFPLNYQKVEAVYLLVDRPFVSDNHWIYFMDGDAAVNRMVEFKNMSGVDCPPNQSVLCAEVTGKHEDVVERVIQDVVKAGLVSRREIIDTLVVREPFSYPVYDRHYIETVAHARTRLSALGNLHLLGRAAEFEHKELDDNFASALKLVKQLLREEAMPLTARQDAPREAVAFVEPLVHVVILALNNYADTRQCLESVTALDYPRVTTVLVDNGSTDDTPNRVRGDFPSVTVIENGRNLGVPAGYNVGFASALGSGAHYVLMLNNDTTVAPNLLRILVDAAEANPTAGILMPKVMYFDDPHTVWAVGGRYRRFPPAIVMVGVNETDRGQYEDLRSIEFAPSCGLLISRKAFELAGLFDPGYTFFFDDWDFSQRVRAHGLGIKLVPTAKMWHKVSRTTRSASDRYWRVWGESCARFYRRHGRPAVLSVAVHVAYILSREIIHGNARWLGQFLQGVRTGILKPLGPVPSIEDQELFRGA